MFPVYLSATYEHRFHSYLRHVTWSRRRPRSNDICVVFAQSSSGLISLGPLYIRYDYTVTFAKWLHCVEPAIINSLKKTS